MTSRRSYTPITAQLRRPHTLLSSLSTFWQGSVWGWKSGLLRLLPGLCGEASPPGTLSSHLKETWVICSDCEDNIYVIISVRKVRTRWCLRAAEAGQGYSRKTWLLSSHCQWIKTPLHYDPSKEKKWSLYRQTHNKPNVEEESDLQLNTKVHLHLTSQLSCCRLKRQKCWRGATSEGKSCCCIRREEFRGLRRQSRGKQIRGDKGHNPTLWFMTDLSSQVSQREHFLLRR